MRTPKSATIAIVDDSPFLREELSTRLAKKGFIVFILAEHGKDLLEQLKNTSELPYLCICDINMPVMDGFETAKAVKSIYPQIKTLSFSTDESEWLQREIMDCGADAFLPKHRSIQTYIMQISALIASE